MKSFRVQEVDSKTLVGLLLSGPLTVSVSTNCFINISFDMFLMFLFTQIDAKKPEFLFYKSGIYEMDICSVKSNHAITLVGYSDKYFLARNSWGPKWGEVRQKSFY